MVAVAQISEEDARFKRQYEKLKVLRGREDLKLKKLTHLKPTFTRYGKEHPLVIRYYQVQGILHLVSMNRFILGDSCGLGKCVVRDTLILTDQGLIPIGDIDPTNKGLNEDLEVGFYELDQGIEVWTGKKMSPVKRFYWGGIRPTKKLVTRNGFEIEGSHQHPVLVWSNSGKIGFKRLSDIKPGDYVCIDRGEGRFPQVEPKIEFDCGAYHPYAKDYYFPTRITPDLARLLGYVVSEGHAYCFTITQHHRESHDDIRYLLSRVFGWCNGDDNNQKRGIQVHVSSIKIRDYLEQCGVDTRVSRYQCVPHVILKSTRNSCREFLRGLFEGDGHAIPGSGIEYSSASEQLIREVQILLLRFGVISVRSPKKVKNKKHTYWRLTIFGDDARIFAQEIGFVSTWKQNDLEIVLTKKSNPNTDIIPFAASLVADLYCLIKKKVTVGGSNHLRKGSGIKQFGHAFQSGMSEIRAGRRNLTYQKLNELLEIASGLELSDTSAFLMLDQIRQSRFFHDPVKYIEDGFSEIMDLEIDDPDHCFVGNGFVNHNTIQAIAALCCLWERNPNQKAIVLTVKSAVGQWEQEFARFTTGVKTLQPRNKITRDRIKGQRWVIGDYVQVVADKHVMPRSRKKVPDPAEEKKKKIFYDKTTPHYKKYDKLVGVVSEIKAEKGNPKGGHVKIDLCQIPGKAIWLPGAMRSRGVGVQGYNGPFVRKKFYDDFASCTGPTVLVMNYEKAVIDLEMIQDLEGYVLIVDECTAFKNPKTDTWDVCNFLSHQAARVWGLTATLIKNKLEEGFGIYKVVVPGLFGSHRSFLQQYCVFFMQQVPGSRRKIPQVTGHRPEQIEAFKERIDPFYLGRAKSEVAKELPSLTTREIRVDMDSSQTLLYNEALTGLLQIGEEEDADIKEVTKLTAITYCQQIANHPELIQRSGKSTKLDKLIQLLTEGEFADEKVIVYTKLRTMVDIAQATLKKGVKNVRVTGSENDNQRDRAKRLFQDPKSGVNVIFITDAGSHAINLQAASLMIFYDTPFSAGNYIQLLGRMIRIGSIHDKVYAIHLMANGSVDERVMEILRGKMDLFEAVIGKRIKEEGDENIEIRFDNDISALFESLREDARKLR